MIKKTLLFLLSIGLWAQGLQQNTITLIPNVADSTTGGLRFAELRAGGTNYVGFKAPTTITTNLTWILPSADSSGTQCLASDGSATLSWAACSGASGGWTDDGAVVRLTDAANTVSIGTATGGRVLDVQVATTANVNNQIRVKGYQASFEVMNQAATDNWYIGIDDADNSYLKIGAGRSPGQGIQSHLTLDYTTRSTRVGSFPIAQGGGLFSVSSNDAHGQNDWVFWTRRDGDLGGGASNHSRFQHFSGIRTPEAVLSGIVARGTVATPTAVQSGDALLILDGRGYDGSIVDFSEYAVGWSDGAASIKMQTTQNWSGTAHGSRILFQTTPNGSVSQADRMVIDQTGYLGVGDTAPPFLLTLKYPAAGTDGLGWPFGADAASRNWLIRPDQVTFGDLAFITSSAKTTGLVDVWRWRIDGTGDFIGRNDKKISMLDSAGTTRPLFWFDATNDLNLGVQSAPATGGDLVLWAAGEAFLELDQSVAGTAILTPLTTKQIFLGQSSFPLRGVNSTALTLQSLPATFVEASLLIYSPDDTKFIRHRMTDGGVSYGVYWPASQGGAATFLRNDGSGNLTWVAGGSVTAVTGTSPIASSGGSTPDIGCSTCVTTNTTQTITASKTVQNTWTMRDINPESNSLYSLGNTSFRWFAMSATTYNVGSFVIPFSGGSGEVGTSSQPFSAARFYTVNLGISGSALGTANFHHGTTAGTASIQADNVTGGVDVAVTRPFYPTSDGSFDLGLATRRWNNVFGLVYKARTGGVNYITIDATPRQIDILDSGGSNVGIRLVTPSTYGQIGLHSGGVEKIFLDANGPDIRVGGTSGITASGTTCTITAIKSGIVTGGSCI